MHRAEERERLARLLRSLAESAVKREMRKAEAEMRQRRGGELMPTLRAAFRSVGEIAAVTAERATWIETDLRRYDETGTSPYLMVNLVGG